MKFNTIKHTISIIFISFIVVSCANFKIHYANDEERNFQEFVTDSLPEKAPEYVLYGIGDAGYLPSGSISPALVEMGKMMREESAESGVVFLGDNIYPSGMPPTYSAKREQAEKNLDAQIETVVGYDGEIVFLPGNHDWRQEDSQKGVQRQEEYLEDKLGKEVHYPDDGCSGPEVFELGDNAVLIGFDSEWFLQDWNKHIDFNERCEYKTRADFLYEINDEIKSYAKDKRVIIAMHHPLYTYGVHGGKFEFNDYLFPLAIKNPKLKIPLPGIGLLYPLFRKNVGEREDSNGERYKELRDALMTSVDAFENVVFISGHEHNMQYIKLDQHHHIVAGSGCKETAVGMGEGAKFTYSKLGFSRLSFYEKGETWMELFACDENGKTLVYHTRLADKLTEYNEAEEVPTYEPPTKPTVNIPIVEESYKRSGFFNMLLGKQYSSLYNIPVKARVTNLAIKEGGLEGIKRGGGFQTNSVRLTNSENRDWVMRAIRKDPSRLLPDEFTNTFATSVVEHFLTTAHPLAAFTLPPMAKAIDIMHTEPELLYIPKQPALGEFNEDNGDKLYLFEARPDDDRSDIATFGNSDNIISTSKMIEEMKESGHKRPDQSSVVRNRLFDMIIGDWDRHDDQWRWAEFEGEGKHKIYRPIPRDRDQAFSIFQGPLIAIGRIFNPGIAKFQSFDKDIKKVGFFNFNARYFDRTFMNELTWEEWQTEIKYIQENLTNEVIHEGISSMQQEFYDYNGLELENNIRGRRDDLEEFAKDYYKSLAKRVDIHATEDDDLIQITKKRGFMEVRISDLDKNKELNYTYYHRIFSDKETNEVVIYGLDGDDIFNVSGTGSNIRVRLVGGTDDDEYQNDGKGGKIHVYDYPQNSEIPDSKGLKLHLTEEYRLNTYDRKAFKYNNKYVFPLAGFNPDNGLLLGGFFNGEWHGFKKSPYAMRHFFSGLYSFETKGYQLNYNGHFVSTKGKWNLRLKGMYQDDLFSNNFFGIGNNTDNPQEEPLDLDRDYNRVRNTTVIVKVLAEKPVTRGSVLYIGPKYEYRNVNFTPGRFLADNLDPTNELFDRYNFFGGEAGFIFRDVDKPINPHQGIDFKFIVDYLRSSENDDYSKASLQTNIGVYFPIDRKENLIWAHKVGAGFTFSDDAFFYHQQQLGGNWGLRGFRNERFTGNSAFYYNTDLRLKLFKFRSYIIPSTVGIYTGLDIGRVWIENDPTPDNSKFHVNFGGGFWLTPFEAATIKLSYFTSASEEGRFIFGVGFDF